MECEIRSFIGTRERQEDSAGHCTDGKGLFAVVCDGIGSRENGGGSSELAVKTLVGEYLRTDFDSFPKRIIELAEKTDSYIYESFGNRSGTTVVAVYIRERELYWFSAGDSRLYILRGGRLMQITTDHNYSYLLKEKRQKNLIDDETYAKEAPKGDRLVSFLGMNGLELIDMNFEPFLLAEGDVLLMTTDGLYKALPEERIRDILGAEEQAADAADALLDEVKSREIPLDNTTFAVIK